MNANDNRKSVAKAACTLLEKEAKICNVDGNARLSLQVIKRAILDLSISSKKPAERRHIDTAKRFFERDDLSYFEEIGVSRDWLAKLLKDGKLL